ncbi:hypothetical protein BASA81_013110 [Batrachochytrium salamandrivorans]|nr:hypothetical protein BASA81_013110 [Batrachochytrium salamandrivorans]
MQFFHLVPFVVVASYAAALPQPAELSEKYLNNVNVNLASGLEARSYQPAFNSQKGSATLVSLKRRDDSDGSSGENSGSDSPPSPPPSPPPATTREKKFSSPFTEETVNSMALASTINNVGDGDAEYSTVGPDLIETSDKLTVDYRADLTALLGATSNIVDDLGSVTENLQTIDRSFGRTVYSRMALLSTLRFLLGKFTAGETLNGYLADISKSIDDFAAEQNELFAKIVEEYEAASSQ